MWVFFWVGFCEETWAAATRCHQIYFILKFCSISWAYHLDISLGSSTWQLKFPQPVTARCNCGWEGQATELAGDSWPHRLGESSPSPLLLPQCSMTSPQLFQLPPERSHPASCLTHLQTLLHSAAPVIFPKCTATMSSLCLTLSTKFSGSRSESSSGLSNCAVFFFHCEARILPPQFTVWSAGHY